MRESFNVVAQVHKPLAKGYRVKVIVHDLGIFINGFVVMPPNDEYSHWSVYPPAQKVFAKYITLVEFNHKLPLWIEIYGACVEVVGQYMSNNQDVVLKDIPDGPINWDEIPGL